VSIDDSGFEGNDWLAAELADTLDEDYELEMSEPALSMELRRIYKSKHPATLDRAIYFKALLTLQAELIKLQDWVEHTGEKLLVIFEGRDSAGKGGVIKRITQRLNPRVCRVVALQKRKRSAPNGTSSATCHICRRAARSCSSIGPGTTDRAWSE